MDRADRADKTVAIPEWDEVPGVVAGRPADDARRRHAVVRAEAGPTKHLLGAGLTAGTRCSDAPVGVECPARGTRALEHGPCLVGDVGHHAHQLVTRKRGQLLDAHRLRERELVGMVQPHRAERDADHRHRGFEQLQMRGLEAAAVVPHDDEAGNHALVLRDRGPHDVAGRAREDVMPDRPCEVRRLIRHGIQHVVAALDHAAKEGCVLDRDRSDRGRRLAGGPRKSCDQARHVDIRQHHVGRSEVVGDRREQCLRELALVGRAGDTHLEHVERFEAGALGLGLREVVGVGQRQADVGGHILQQLHVPLVKRAFRVGLEREHRRDPFAAQHRHPHEGARHPATGRRRTRHENGRALAHGPDLALELLALERAGPRRLPDEDGLARFIGLARGTGDRQRDRRHHLLDACHVLVPLRLRPVCRLGDRRQDEAVEGQVR